MEGWRDLIYPLGFISNLCFTLRFLYQWIYSEKAHESVVVRPFWLLSILGSSILYMHSVLQGQFFIALSQAANLIIAWRNLDLMQHEKPQKSLRFVLLTMSSALLVTLLLFLPQQDWIRIPTYWTTASTSFSFLWHIVGLTGVILFSSRFWVQWWIAERKHQSVLPTPFWWLSLIGALFSIFYFAKLHDPVNLLGPIFGLIPYIRNLMLIRQKEVRT